MNFLFAFFLFTYLIQVVWSSSSIPFRNNLCPFANAFQNASIDVRSLLMGLNLTVGIPATSNPLFMAVDESGQPYGGVNYEIQQAIAGLYGIQFNYYTLPNILTTQSLDSYVLDSIRHVDFFPNGFSDDTMASRALGVEYVQEIMPSSLVLATYENPAPFPLFQFILTFSHTSWGIIALFMIMNGVFNWHLRYIYEEEEYQTFLHSIYLSFTDFTASELMEPNKFAPGFLHIGYGFWHQLMIAYFIANLAAVLFAPTDYQLVVSSIGYANTNHIPICVSRNSMAESFLSTNYMGIPLVSVDSDDPIQVFIAMANDACKGVVTQQYNFEYASQIAEANPNCNLAMAGGVVMELSGSWPYLLDFDQNCTSIVGTILSMGVDNLQANDLIRGIWSNALGQAYNLTCSADAASATMSVGFKETAGVHIIYAIALGLAFVVLGIDFTRKILLGSYSSEDAGVKTKE